MKNQERAANLARIATSAVAIERSHGIPAELACGQCVIESSWLAKAPGNNCFGIKASPLKPSQWLETTERLTAQQLAVERAKGKPIKSVGPPDNTGKCVVVMDDAFAVYGSLTECFEAYAELLVTGKYFKARFERFKAHGDVVKLLTDMSGSDGQPPYFTGGGYVKLWQTIVDQSNVKAALQVARAAASMTIETGDTVGKFISANPDENATLEQARKLVRQRALLGLPSLGIVANGQGVQDMVDEADFAANGILVGDNNACLLIRTRKGADADENNSVAGFGDHINVGQTLRMIAKAPNVVEGIRQVLANEGVNADLESLPGVAQAKYIAIAAAWGNA